MARTFPPLTRPGAEAQPVFQNVEQSPERLSLAAVVLVAVENSHHNNLTALYHNHGAR